MRRVYCSYENCANRRTHYENPYTLRNHQMVEVPDDYDGPAFCSMECAAYAGVLSKNFDDQIKEND